MRELISAGAEVLAISPSGAYSSLFKQHNIDFVSFEFDRLSFNPVTVRGVLYRLTKLLQKIRPEFLHTFTLRPNAYGGIAGRIARVPVIISSITGLGSLYSDDFGLWGSIARFGVNSFTRKALYGSSAIIFQNTDDREYYLDKRLCRPEQTRLIAGSGIDVNLFSPQAVSEESRVRLREEWRIGPNEIVVTMIARLLTSKGVYEFLQAADQLRDRARFVLIGDSDPGNPSTIALDNLRSMVSNDNLIAPGHQENIRDWLAISNIYALPSYREGLPRTVLEAMAMSLPIITTDVPGCRETVKHGENGILIPVKDSQSLILAIKYLLENPKLRSIMGKCSRDLAASKFANQIVVQEHMNLYQELCHSFCNDN
jgi:N,N'-diacetylbacillosaminyl-diphospho-undecaprenol alpha-1,3-N-acetylgalactosaminyltransferase